MRVEERLKAVTEKVYIADDGTEFSCEESCKSYEFMEKQRNAGNVVFLVTHKFKPCGPEVFSTRELAEKSIENAPDKDRWHILEIVIDGRFLR